MRFSVWEEAHTAAVKLSRLIKHDVGIWRQEEYGKDGYNIRSLPKPENRYGHELRCEVVSPSDPYITKKERLMNTQTELTAVTKLKPKRGEDEDNFRQRLVEAVSDLDDKAYGKLTKATRSWADNAIEAFNDTGKVPAFDDADDEEDEEDVGKGKNSKSKKLGKKKKVSAKDDDEEEQRDEEQDVADDDDAVVEATEEDEDMTHTDTDRGGNSRRRSTKKTTKQAAPSKKKKKVAAGSKTDEKKGASGQLALRKLLVRDPNMTNDDLTTRLEKAGYELSSITISSQRSAFRNIVKVLQEADLLKKKLIT